MIDLEFHPIADIFPMMDDAGLRDLAKDIADNGLLEAIWVDDQSRIVDGRNRYRACGIADVEPTLRPYKEADHGPLVTFVVSLNLKRRHLSESQRAAVGAKIANMTVGNPNWSDATDCNPRISNAEAAALMNVGATNVKAARRLAREAPDDFAKVEKGEMSVGAAIGKLTKSKPPKPKSEPKAMPAPRQLRVIHDSDDEIAEQICHLCNRLSEVADRVSPEGIWPKLAGNPRFANNINRSLSAASHFLSDLHLLWARSAKKNAAG